MTQRHHLGGDRQASRALHLAVISRIRLDPRAQTYVAKRTGEWHSKMEIIRCLKRYLAHEVYFILNPAASTSSRTPDNAEPPLDT
jgi:hypothetical protein